MCIHLKSQGLVSWSFLLPGYSSLGRRGVPRWPTACLIFTEPYQTGMRLFLLLYNRAQQHTKLITVYVYSTVCFKFYNVKSSLYIYTCSCKICSSVKKVHSVNGLVKLSDSEPLNMIRNIHSSIEPFSSAYPFQGRRGTEAYPSCLRVKGRVHPRQVASLSQG